FEGQTRNVAARPRETRNRAGANWVVRHRENNRDDRCSLLCCEDGSPGRDNNIDLEPNKLGGDLGKALAVSLCPAIFDRNGAPFDPAEFTQPLHKSSDPRAKG